MKKGDEVLYRGNKCKVLNTKMEKTSNNYNYEMIRLKHLKYQLWVNAKFVIKC